MGKVIEKVYLLNFGAELSESIIEDIKKKENILELEQIRIKRSLNLKKHSIYIQVHDIVEEFKDYFTSKHPVIINLPGLPIYAACLITEISALTGKLPIIVECVKDYDSDGVFSDFKFKRLYNLDRERAYSRESYKSGGRKKLKEETENA